MLPKLLPILALIPAAVSAYVWPEPWFGVLALLSYLLACGLAIGPSLAPTLPRPHQLGLGIMATLAATSILGSVVYYSATVTTESLFAVLVVIAIISCLFAQPTSNIEHGTSNIVTTDLTLFAFGSLSLVGWWIAVLNHQITEPVRSLWLILDPFALVAIGLATGCAIALLVRHRSQHLSIILLAAVFLSVLALAAAMYPLGYGFDPFLHRASVAHIAEHGTISPKPLYYIGQYALELIGLKLFALPLFALDTWLVPLLASFGITLALASRQVATKSPHLILACLLFLPLGAFVQTTPQALAFVFTSWCLLVPTKPRALPILFALAAVITHPLAGIGALIYVALLLVSDVPERFKQLRQAGLTLLTLLASISIPVAFAVQAKLAHLPLKFDVSNLLNLSQLPIGSFLHSQFNAWGDLAYIFIGNAFLIVVGLAIVGIILTPKSQTGWYIPGLVALAMFTNFVIVSLGFDFAFLIAYERLDFALRLLTLTTLFLLPYIAVLLSTISKKLINSPVSLRLGLVVLLSIFFTCNVYSAYPRHDNYARSSGFNLGPADFDAVSAIEIAAENEPYIVLSDQALAAAAVQELGFKQYYHDDIFFYPIPTGGPLYQHFLTMVEDRPSADTMSAAMDLAGVDLAFFAVHNYWWQAPQIIENTKLIADDWFAVGDGAVTVFVFRRS